MLLVYSFSTSVTIDDWRSDQYRWFHNVCKKLPESDPILEKRYFVADTPEGRNSGFKCHVFNLLESTNKCILVHYLGDESFGSQHPHGNCKTYKKKPYVRTCPSVLHTASKMKEPSHDALFNLHKIAFNLDGYVSKIVTYPDLLVICGLKSILSELNWIISTGIQSLILLSYDTTFKLGDFYVLPLLFHHVVFE